VSEPRRFFCRECGADVTIFVPLADNDDEVCLTCGWLLTIEDPKVREELRKKLLR
jgi:rubredoxin